MATFSLTAEDAGGFIGYWDVFYGSVTPNPVYLNANLNRLTYYSDGSGELIFDGPGTEIPAGGVISMKINGVSQTITPIIVDTNYAEYGLQHSSSSSPFVNNQTYTIEMIFAGEQPPAEPGTPTTGIIDKYGYFESSISGAADAFDDGIAGQILSKDFFSEEIVSESNFYLGIRTRAQKYLGIRNNAALYLGSKNFNLT